MAPAATTLYVLATMIVMSKMATIFNGCSPEEIENGKQFWKSIDELQVRKSTLSSYSIPEIGQKLASQPLGTGNYSSLSL